MLNSNDFNQINEEQKLDFDNPEKKKLIIAYIEKLKAGVKINDAIDNPFYKIIAGDTAGAVGKHSKLGFTKDFDLKWKQFFSNKAFITDGVWSQRNFNDNLPKKAKDNRTYNYYATIEKTKENILRFLNNLSKLDNDLNELSNKTQNRISYKTHRMLDAFIVHNDSLKVYYYDATLKQNIETIVNNWLDINGINKSDRTHYHGVDKPVAGKEGKQSFGQLLATELGTQLKNNIEKYPNYTSEQWFEWVKKYSPDIIKRINIGETNINKQVMKNLIKKKLIEMVGENEPQNYMFFNNLKTIHDAIGHMLEMNPQQVDQLLSDGHNWATDHLATSADDIEEVYHFLNANLDQEEPDSYDGETQAGYQDEYGTVEDGAEMMNEAKYKNKTVKLGKPTKGDVKKFKVYVKNKKGNVIKVNFGDKKMEIKRDNPERRKSFRARHKCAQAKDRTTPKYWSCRMWSKTPVSKMVAENFENTENLSIFVKSKDMTQPMIEPRPTVNPQKNPSQPFTTPADPSRRNKPFLPNVTPGIKTDPKAIK